MTRTTRRLLLGTIGGLSAILLIAFVAGGDLTIDEKAPADPSALGGWIAEHPADWRAAAALSGAALDSTIPRRRELWRAAHAHALLLAPRRPAATTGFVRGGLFHWYELGDADRKAVLTATAPLLREQATFQAMHRPLWQLTGDFAFLRANAPDTESALTSLRDIAATNGLFAEYRSLRAAIDRKRLETFRARRAALSPPELIAMVPGRLTSADEPLVQGVLKELQRRPLDAGNADAARGRADELVRFAVRHQLRPLDGLDAIIDTPSINSATRARLALALGRAAAASNIELTAANSGAPEWLPYYLERGAFEAARGDAALAAMYRLRASLLQPAEAGVRQWSGTCAKNEVCGNALARIPAARAGEILTVAVENAQSDEVPPYVEIYAGDTLLAEGPVKDKEQFRIAAPAAGLNRVELRLANPRTRNGLQRRVRLS